MSRIISKAREAGYVNHERSTSDKRSVRVRLTPRGQDIRKKIDALLQQAGSIDHPMSRGFPATSSTGSTRRWAGWNGSGPTKSSTACKVTGAAFARGQQSSGLFYIRISIFSRGSFLPELAGKVLWDPWYCRFGTASVTGKSH